MTWESKGDFSAPEDAARAAVRTRMRPWPTAEAFCEEYMKRVPVGERLYVDHVRAALAAPAGGGK